MRRLGRHTAYRVFVGLLLRKVPLYDYLPLVIHIRPLQDFGTKHIPPTFPIFQCLGQLRFSRALKSALGCIAETGTTIHSHGLWRMSNIYPASVGLRGRNHLVLSPRGMLGEAALEFSARKKQLFLDAQAQGSAARAASCLHATSRQEYEEIRAFGLKAPIAIIPNGIDVLSSWRQREPATRGSIAHCSTLAGYIPRRD